MSQKEKLQIHEFPSQVPLSPLYEVTINGCSAPVFHTAVADFVALCFDGTVEISVRTRKPVQKFTVRPVSRKICSDCGEMTIRFLMHKPENLCVDAEGLPLLFIYASAPDLNAPAPDDPGVRYFKAGQVYETGEIRLESGQSLYIEGGAVVRGCVYAENCTAVAVRGRGVIDGGFFTKGPNRRRTVFFESCDQVAIEGVSVVNPSAWTTVLRGCTDVLISDYKVIGDGHGSDGIDIVSCRDVTVQDCMIRSGDDAIVIKAFESAGSNRSTDVENVVIERCVLMSVGAGNTLEIGHELRTEFVRNITYRDCDILCKHGHGAAISIHNADRAAVSDVLYDTIRIEHHYTYLFDLRVFKTMWSSDNERGQIRNVVFRDILVDRSIYNPGYSICVVGGYDRDHMIRNVVFDNIVVNGVKAVNSDSLDLYSRNASGMEFS